MPSGEVIHLSNCDDLRDVVHRAVACLAQGGLVSMPTSHRQVVAACAIDDAAVQRLLHLQAGAKPLAIGLGCAAAGLDWARGVSPAGRRMMRRLWPGPVTFQCKLGPTTGLWSHLPPRVAQAVGQAGALSLECPSHSIAREILGLLPCPIVIANESDARTDQPIDQQTAIEMILRDERMIEPKPNTIVELTERDWTVLEIGAVGADVVAKSAAVEILFVCTGNTCRSPMAEALCKAELARRLACSIDELTDRGFYVHSAGLAASHGARAAANAQEVVEARGGSLRRHSSKALGPRHIDEADYIIAMTQDHLSAILEYHPSAIERAQVLDRTGDDIEDPIGSSRLVYDECAERIHREIRALLDSINVSTD